MSFLLIRHFWIGCFRLFGFLVVLFLPLSYGFIPSQIGLTDAIFGWLVEIISVQWFGFNGATNSYYSDSVSTFSLYLILLVLAALLALLLHSERFKGSRTRIIHFTGLVLTYFVSYQMLQYGLDKVFLGQFYTPTSYVLETPFGQLDRDLLYWSTIGLSPMYSIFLGLAEVLSGLLILWKKTRSIGMLMVVVIMTQVVAINFSFDISVKMFSLFLWITALHFSWSNIVFILRSLLSSNKSEIRLPSTSLQKGVHMPVFLQILIAGLICCDALYPFIAHQNVEPIKPYGNHDLQSDSLPALNRDWHFFIESIE